MSPNLAINYPAVVVATLVQFVLSWLWFGPLFGKAWASEMNMSMDAQPPRSVMIRGMVLSFVGSLLTAYVLAHDVTIWRPSVWGAGPDAGNATYGFFAAFFVWLGYYIPQDLSYVAWQMKSWKFFAIQTSNHFLSLLAAGMILAFWR